MSSVVDFLKRASDRNGFNRDRFEERKIPTDFTNITVFPFFGDLRNLTILSSYLLHRYRQEVRGSKYFIMASWPGFQGLFPYVDEYWSLGDDSIMKRFYEHSEGMRNKSDLYTTYIRSFNEFFRDIIDANELQKYYRNGFTSHFFERFVDTKRFLPFVPSSTIIGKDFNRQLMMKSGYKVLLHPSIFVKFWHNGISDNVRAKKDFYVGLCKFLLKKNITPIVWQNHFSYDLSTDLEDSCIYLRENDIVKVLSAMRASGCVIDTFNGLSRLSMMARCPYVCVDERSRYSGTNELEIDCLSGYQIPSSYIFSFSTIITSGELSFWNADIYQTLHNKLEMFLPELNRDEWPSTAEGYESLAYDEIVHKQKKKKLGTRFIKVANE